MAQNLPASTFAFGVIGNGGWQSYMAFNAAGSCAVTQIGSGRDAFTDKANNFGQYTYLTYNPAIANNTYSTGNAKVHPLSRECVLLIKY